MNTAHGTLQVTYEEIIVISHLVLQVYRSPSLKQHLHNPVMSLLACTKERKESILYAYGGVCMCVCVCGYVYIYIRVSVFRMVDTNLQVQKHVSVITQVQ